MSNFMGLGIFWIGLNWADLGCWRLTLKDARQNNNGSTLNLMNNVQDDDCNDVSAKETAKLGV